MGLPAHTSNPLSRLSRAPFLRQSGDALDVPRRIAQERVPTASSVGSRDVTWASQPAPLIPFRVFSRVARAWGLNQPQLHFAGFADHMLVPRRIPH